MMGYGSKLANLKAMAVKAQGLVAENQGQIKAAVKKAGAAANEKTGGKYEQQITKAEAAASTAVNKVVTTAPEGLGSAEPKVAGEESKPSESPGSEASGVEPGSGEAAAGE